LDNIYSVAEFRGKIIFNNDTITDKGSGINDDLILCKIRSDGKQEWVKQFTTKHHGGVIDGLDVKNNHIVMMGATYQDTVFLNNFPPMTFLTKTGYFIYHTDSNGNTEDFGKILESYNIKGNVGTFGFGNKVSFNHKTNDIALLFDFDTTFTYTGKTVKVYPGTTSIAYNNSIIQRGGINCFLPNIPNIKTPYSSFMASSYTICKNQSVSFVDYSANAPTSWSWSFPGGIPSTSTQQNPTVTYNDTGIFYATLSTSNSFGTGTSYSAQIKVVRDVNPNLSISGDTMVCVGGTTHYIITTDSMPLKYQWQDSSSTHSWQNIDTATYKTLNITNIPITDRGKKYRAIATNNCSSYISNAITLNVNPLVNFVLAPDTICPSASPILLTGGSPAGGTYSGKGVVNGYLNTTIAGGGTDTLKYTYTDANFCTNSKTVYLYITLVSCHFKIVGYNLFSFILAS
jgi:PKD repeat protein